jgi:hypothetical protein
LAREQNRTRLKAHVWKKQRHGHYVEPTGCTRALLQFIEFPRDGTIWDPCCGFGRVPRAVRDSGLKVIGSDIVDRGGMTVPMTIDFLKHQTFRGRRRSIVSNPPFLHIREFVLHALELTTEYVAIVMPVRRLPAIRKWAEGTPLYYLLFLTPRPSMPPGSTVKRLARHGRTPSGGTQEFAWLIWKHGHKGPPFWGWLQWQGHD